MKNFVLLFFLFFTNIICLKSQNINVDSIIIAVQNKLLSTEQINYTCNYSSFNIGSTDTDRHIIKSKIRKVEINNKTENLKVITSFYPNNPNFEVKAYYDVGFGFYYLIKKDKKEVTFYKMEGNGRGVMGYFHSALKYIIDSAFLKQFKSNISIQKFIGIDTFNNFQCYVIESRIADMLNFTNFSTKFYINTKDLMFVRILNSYIANSEPVFFDFKITKYNFNKDSINDFFKLPDLKNYTIKYDTTEAPIKDYILLNKNIEDIEGVSIKTLKAEKIIFKNKITLIDFWYMGCYGCMLSYPVIDSLNSFFQTNKNVQIISLNGIDTSARLTSRRQRYLIDNKMLNKSYTITRKTFDSFKENAMPFFLIIDEKGIIRYQSVGYHIDLYEELKNKILNLTKQ
ncbi:MAG: redoxin domain-containing protein [Bacteroidia bacterium]|nr:redoxin domain-containing protein [Bacteroidia bacterium]